MNSNDLTIREMCRLGRDVLENRDMQALRTFPQHGFTHAREALCNAQTQFELNEIERDVIKKHMFPLNIALPRYRETALVSAADKISAVMELVHSARALRILKRCRAVGL